MNALLIYFEYECVFIELSGRFMGCEDVSYLLYLRHKGPYLLDKVLFALSRTGCFKITDSLPTYEK